MEPKIIHYRTENLGNGIIKVCTKEGEFIAKIERTRRGTWNIVQSSTGFIDYGYETKNEAVISAYTGKDYRMYSTGL